MAELKTAPGRKAVERVSKGSVRGSSGTGVALCRAIVLLGVWVALLLGGAPALAASQRDHVFGGRTFAGSGEGAGELNIEGGRLGSPAGLGVDEASGDVYVVDSGNHRVDVFSGSGGFLEAWGWGVANGAGEYETCVSSCEAGLVGGGMGEFREPDAVTVDNSPEGAGGVFVNSDASSRKPDVQRFSSEGGALGRLHVEEEGRVDGLAADREGDVWVYRGEEEESGVVEGFTDAVRPVRLETVLGVPFLCPKPGFGVDAAGEMFVAGHELLDGEEECPAVVERERRELKEPAEGALLRPDVLGSFQGEEALTGTLERQQVTGVAVDQASSEQTPLGATAKGDVYVDEGSVVVVFDSAGHVVGRFGEGVLEHGEGVAIDSKTGDVYVLDAGRERVDVFEPEGEGAPSVSELSAQDLTPSEVSVSGRVDPRGWDTHYLFQYGTGDCVSEPAACTDVPAAPGADAGDGFAALSVSVTLTGLAPGTVYHYRLIARNGLGEAEGSQTQGTFQTLPVSAGVLADGRAWEMVSPAEKDGSGIEALSFEGGLIQASPDGNTVSYVANGPVEAAPAGSRAPEPTQVLSVRSQGGWSSQDLMTVHDRGEGFVPGEPAEYRLFSEGLAVSLLQPPLGGVQPLEEPPLAPGATEKTIYVRADPPVIPDPGEEPRYREAAANAAFMAPGFAALLTGQNTTGGFAGRVQTLDATPDLAHVVFESTVGLLSGQSAGLYESSPGKALGLVSVLPDGMPASSPALGDEGINVRGALSDDGSRVFFWAEGEHEGEAPALYMRDTSRDETLKLSAAQGVTEPVGEEGEVDFQAATPDGSRVFFTDTVPLTPGSTQQQAQQADLYECEIVERAGKLACNLTDLTPVATGGSADVLNVIPGVSEDGSTVFFVANGVLAPGAVQGHCTHEATETPIPGAVCDLYVWHEGQVRLVAVLSNADSGDWGSLRGSGRVTDFVENRPDLADVTSRVSANGEYLAFMSEQPLTGYDNHDANNPAVRDQEVFLYQRSTGLLTCVSCNPNGPSVGVHDLQQSGEGVGLVVDRRQDWLGAFLAGSVPGWTALGLDGATHQPRYLSDEGRLFFNSPDRLVPQATNDKMDVYEYEPNGLGSCALVQGCVSLISSGSAEQESAFLEASENGDDAFFVTAQPLVAADQDSDYDLYDARVCTPGSPCLTSEQSSQRPCETTASCRPSMTSPLGVTAPGSETEPANQPTSAPAAEHKVLASPTQRHRSKPTRGQLLAKALRSCRRHHKRGKTRHACETLARKRYAPKQHKPHARKTGHTSSGKRRR
jgi:NHL repeat